MALKRQQNWLSEQRVDVPHLRAFESSIANDFDSLLRNAFTRVGSPYFIRGFTLLYSIGSPATSTQVIVDDAVILHSTATEPGTLLTVPAGAPNDILNDPDIMIGGFVSGTTNYIALDYTRTPDDTTLDTVKFLSPDTHKEFTKVVPLAKTLQYQYVVNTTGFGTLLPIASITVSAGGLITSMTDCRPLLLRLGTGGSTPNPLYVYPWPDGADVPASGRAENPSTSSIPGVANTPFEGGDKEIGSIKDLWDALMSRVLEMDGGPFWYSPSVGSLTGLVQDTNVHMLDQGVVWSWNLTTQTLSWAEAITGSGAVVHFQIPGTTNNNTIANGSKVLTVGQVAYVTINRTATATLAVTAVAAASLPIDDDVFVFARRDGDDVLVGTHSFRIKPADATESDYSDHLAKERLLKPIVNQTAPDNTIQVYPAQRLSGNKRRYVYIAPSVSSQFPRNPYVAGSYDGGATDEALSTITFEAINAGTDIQVSAALPHNTPGILLATSSGVYNNAYTPVLICVTSADSFEVVVGTPQASLSNAKLDAYLPASPTNSYPVAVVVVYITTGGSGTVQPITESFLLDRRPTGAGGSGGGTTGNYNEQIATAGQTIFTLPWAYIVGLNDISVVENGVELFLTYDYVETDTTHITLNYPAVAGDRYKFRTGKGLVVTSIGNVVGPAFGGSTDNAIARWDLTTGKLLQNSVGILNDFGDLSGIRDLTMTGTLTGGSSPFVLKSVETDGGTALAFRLNTQNALTNAAALLLSLQNNSVAKLVVDKDGNITVVGTVDGVDVSAIPGTVSAKVAKAGDTMTGDLVMDNQKAIELREATGGGTDSVKIQAPAALAASYTLTLPVDDGTSNQVLTTDGNGVLSWANVAVGALMASLFTAKGDILSASAASTPLILPVGVTPNGYVLSRNSATSTGLEWSAAGAGDVIGPASSTDLALVRWDGVSGELIQDSGWLLNASDIMTMGGAFNSKAIHTAIDMLTAGQRIVGVTNTATTPPRTITLSDADKVDGREIFIKDESGGATANPILILPESGTIDGAGSVTISVDYGCLRVYSDGFNWYSL